MALLAVGAAVAVAIAPYEPPAVEIPDDTGNTGQPTPIQSADERDEFTIQDSAWSELVGTLSEVRRPIAVSDSGDGEGGEGGDGDPDAEAQAAQQAIANRNRPAYRYLGDMSDRRGPLGLLAVGGGQKLVRVGDVIDAQYEVKSIAPDKIVLAEGRFEYEFELAPSTLSSVQPSQTIDRPARNAPSADPRTRTPNAATPPDQSSRDGAAGRPTNTPQPRDADPR